MRTSIAIATTALLAGCLDGTEPTTAEHADDLDLVALPPRPDCLYTARTVHTAQELADTLALGPGQAIQIPSGTVINMSDARFHNLEIPSCTIISGTRDKLDRGPLLYTSDATSTYDLLVSRGNHVRITGLRIAGPANPDYSRSSSILGISGIRVRITPNSDWGAYLGRDIVIENNELLWWSNAAVHVTARIDADSPADVPAGTPLVGRDNRDEVVIRGNYIHHNARDGLGYGVNVSHGAYATIERNVFDYNRHAIASDGSPYTGYLARHNYMLDGGYSESSYGFDYWNQHFDVHGTGDGGYGGVAGEYYEVAENTFRGAQGYGVWPYNYQRPCLMVRATPMDHIDFHDNIALQWSDQCVRRKGEGSPVDRVYDFDNTYHLDTHDELGVGDFDGDGLDDVIVTTGTAWYYSSAGRTEWRFLRSSGIRVANLAFADIDNDGKTDVLTRLSDGNINVAYGGTTAWTALTPSAESITQCRFGDFDGDGRTDIFRRGASGVWSIWYGSTHTWTTLRTFAAAIDDLRFGEFDGKQGTDVVATINGKWMWSSGATYTWLALNDALAPLADTRVGDFDGDGRDDLAFPASGQWRYSDDGRTAALTLRSSDGGIALAGVQLGAFDGTGVSEALRIGSDGKFAVWTKNTGDGFVTRSSLTMR